MFGQNWNEVVNEGNPAVYLRLKSSVGSYLQHQPARPVTLHSLLFPEIRIKSKNVFGNGDEDNLDDHYPDDQQHFRDD